jgi:hypothetical protein
LSKDSRKIRAGIQTFQAINHFAADANDLIIPEETNYDIVEIREAFLPSLKISRHDLNDNIKIRKKERIRKN